MRKEGGKFTKRIEMLGKKEGIRWERNGSTLSWYNARAGRKGTKWHEQRLQGKVRRLGKGGPDKTGKRKRVP